MPVAPGSVLRPFPAHTLEKALVIVTAIVDKGGGKAMDRLLVADAIGRTPSSSEYKRLLSSSRAYGLTSGTEKAEYVSPTELGLKIMKPLNAEEELQAKVQACLNVELIGKLWRQYNRSKVPDVNFLKNMLERSYASRCAAGGGVCDARRGEREILRRTPGHLWREIYSSRQTGPSHRD